MTEAPERIFAISGLHGTYVQDWSEGEWFTKDGPELVQYIRKDVSDALVATAREKALREALDAAREYRHRRGEAVENAILALIDKDNSRKAKKPNLVGTGVQVGLLKKNPGG